MTDRAAMQTSTNVAHADAAPRSNLAPQVEDAERGAADAGTQRICILVLGMHRSGTSALTRAISLLGAELPKLLLAPNAGNPAGYWEPARLVELHDQMLAEANSRWDDWRPFAMSDLPRKRAEFYRAEIVRILFEEFDRAPLFVLKEPRISRFVPLYAEIFQSMGVQLRFVHTSRNPLAVAASLSAREGSTRGFNALLWLRHELDAELATRHKPRVFVSYEALVDQPLQELEKIGRVLGITWPRPIGDAAKDVLGHLSAKHRNHVANPEILSADRGIPEWVKEAYLALKALESDVDDPGARTTLDRVRSDFGAVPSAISDFLFEELASQRVVLEKARAEATRVAEETRQLVETARLQAEQSAERAAQLQQAAAAEADGRAASEAELAGRVGLLENERDASSTLAKERGDELAQLAGDRGNDVTVLKDQLRRLEAKAANLASERDRIHAAVMERDGEISRLAAEAQKSTALAEERDRLRELLDKRDAEIARVSAEARQLDETAAARLVEAQEAAATLAADQLRELEQLRQKLEERAAEAAGLMAEIERMSAEIGHRDGELEVRTNALDEAEQAHIAEIDALAVAFRTRFETLLAEQAIMAEQLAAQEAMTAEQKRACDMLREQIRGLEEDLGRARNQTKAREIEIDALRQRSQTSIAQLQAHVNAILRSTSWRVLSPVRVAKTFWITKVRGR
ncbi:MAG: sulfotransferase [Mesorhizobium sp.]|nr:sulfotransferase [Mesorhizobium sp.]